MTRSLDSIRYSPMSLASHPPSQVAPLIYESAPELFALLFGSQAIPILSNLVERSHNRFSHQYVWVAELKGHVIGAAVLIPAEDLSNQGDTQSVLAPGRRIWVALVRRFLLNAILRHDYPPGTVYIGNLAVHADYRGNGIGTQLLKHCIASAESHQAPSIFISVDIDNPRAQSLYESLGFCPIQTKSLQIFNRAIGSVVLEKKLFPDNCYSV